MSLAQFSVRRPVFVVMVTLIIIILGVVSLYRIPVDLMPDVTYPTLSVSTTYENASPAEIEELVTRLIEEALSSVPGVEEVSSTSSEGNSDVRVTFTWGSDLDAAANDVRDRIDRIIPRLPEEAERPTLRKFDLASFPVLILGASSRLDPVQMRKLIDDQVKYRIERVPGVAALDIRGGQEREIHVLLDPDKIKALGIPLDTLQDRIRTANITLPAGTLESGNYEIVVRTPGEYTNLDQLRETIVAVREGFPIHLADVADIKDSWRKITRIVRVNGEPGLRLAVNKQSGKNTVEVARETLKEVEQINRDIPQLKIVPLIDTSRYIRSSITNVGSSALYGGLYAILILLLFLRNVRSTIIIAIAIPISIVATFMLIYFAGFTLNLMTLGGLALGVGMLVDNSIVVLENIYRMRDEDRALTAEQGAILGTGEVTEAIISSTLTTLVVFLPLIFVRGMAGVMFKQLAYIVSFSLLCSLGVALTLVPMLAARYLHPVRLDADADETFLHKVFRVIGRFLEALERRYQRVLHVALNHRLWVVVGAVVLLTGSLALIPLIGTELMPVTDEGEVRVNVEMEVGTRLSLLDETFQPIEALVAREVPEAQSTVVTLGGSGGHASASNIGEMRVALKPLGERHRSSDDIAAVLRRKLTGIPGTTIRTRAGQGLFILRMAAGTSDQIAVEIRGYDIEKADALARRVKEIVDRVEGVTDTRISRDSGQPERLIVIDRSKAESMKVTVAQVAGMLQTVLGGTLAGYYRDSGDEYGIRVQVRDSEKQSMDDLLNLILTNSDGQPVVLRNVVSVQPRNGPVVIERKNQERIVSVTGNIRGRDMGAILADIRHGLEGVPVPRDFSIGFGGDYDEQQKAFRELGLGLILALVLVYMVMACQYESLKDPFVVMFSVPLAVVGVVVMLLLTNTTFNVQSYIGCIMLGGIVVNNAILLVDHTNLLRRRDGLGVREAIEEAGRRRLRPILMTALTTLLGLVPLALGAGEGGEAQAPLARAVIGGLLSSTVFTLVFIPVVYSLFEEKRRRTVGGKGLVVVLLLVSASGTAYAAPEPDAEPSVPPPAATTVPPALELRLGQSVLMALTNNRALAMQRLSPEIQRTFEDQERAVFDPRFSGRVTFERTPEVLLPASTNRLTDLTTGEVALESGLPSGTRVGVGLRTERNRVGGDPDVVGTTAELGVTQALLQGRPIEVNLASLRQARLATDISVYELRGFAEALVAEVETTYWEGVLARRRVQIYQESLSLADQQLEEISHRIKVGALAETELAAAQAETALRREGLINARSELALQSLHLLRLINPGALRGTGRDLMFSTIPAVPETPADQVAAHVQRALSARPDLKEARLKAESAGLELVKTRNGLLPKLDVFVTLGKTGYANSFGDSARNLESADPTLAAGVAFEYPFSNRSAEARHRRARYTQEQVREALTNMADLARVDIESACIERERTRAQVTATATTRRFQEEKVRSETAKFGVGRSTTLLVAQAQRDLIESQVSEVDAVIKHLQACIALYRLEGSLLDRRGIAVTDVPARFP